MENKSLLIAELWKHFQAELSAEWPKVYAEAFGPRVPTDQLPQRFNFARAVHAHARKKLARAGSPVKALSADTLNRVLQANKLSDKLTDRSLNFYAAYCGYRDWHHFVRTQERAGGGADRPADPSAPAEDAPLTVLPPTPPAGGPSRPGRAGQPPLARWWPAAALALLLAGWGGYHSWRMAQHRTAIEAVIRNSVEQEYRAYAALPAVDTTYFSGSYTVDCDNRREIAYIILANQERGWRLRQRSSSELIDVKVTDVDDQRATARSREKWFLIWYDPASDKDMRKYDKINNQDYTLLRTEQGWRIKANAYAGTFEVLNE